MSNYYQHISKTPLSVFIDCLVDHNLKALIIEGEVEEFVLADTWQNLQEQYSTAMGSTEHKLFIKLLKDVNITTATINQCRVLIDTMREAYHESLGKLLSKLLSHTFRWAYDRVEVDKNLDRAELLLKGLQMQLEIKKSSFDALQKKMEAAGGTKPSREYFDTMLNLLEEHSKLPVTESITVSRYCDKVQRMNNHYKRFKK